MGIKEGNLKRVIDTIKTIPTSWNGKKAILEMLASVKKYQDQQGPIDRSHLNDEDQKNRETAIQYVVQTETEIAVLEWVLGLRKREINIISKSHFGRKAQSK